MTKVCILHRRSGASAALQIFMLAIQVAQLLLYLMKLGFIESGLGSTHGCIVAAPPLSYFLE